MSKIKNILIFIGLGIALILIYVFLIKKSPDQGSLVAVPSSPSTPANIANTDSSIAKDFLSILLNVKNIKLDDAIFSDEAFVSLHDSSILLTPDGNEGRPNPFAPFGFEIMAAPIGASNPNIQTQFFLPNFSPSQPPPPNFSRPTGAGTTPSTPKSKP